MRKGFTLIETTLVLGVLVLATMLVIPLYNTYLVQSDLAISRQNVIQGLQRASLLASVAYDDAQWGYSTDAIPGRGVIYKGESYALRDPGYDELYSIPTTVDIEGLSEVTFRKGEGTPQTEGIITLRARNQNLNTVEVHVQESDPIVVPNELIDVCVDPFGENPRTTPATQAQWEALRPQGALLGSCASVGAIEQVPKKSAGTVTIVRNGMAIEPVANYTCEVIVLGSDMDAASAAYKLVTLALREDGSWTEPFGAASTPVASQINDDSDQTADCVLSSIASGTPFHLRFTSWVKRYNWLDGGSDSDWKQVTVADTSAGDASVQVLIDRDPIPSQAAFASLTTIPEFLRTYVDLSGGTMDLLPGQALYLFEAGSDPASAAADFKDLAVLVRFLSA